MDNPQATREFMLGYLGGMIDGEGTIGCHKGSSGATHTFYKPVIKIFNTNMQVIQTVTSFLDALGVPYYIHASTPRIQGRAYTPCYAVEMSGLKRISRALDALTPAVRAKAAHMRVLQEIIHIRLGTPRASGRKNYPWGDREMQLVRQLRDLNQRPRQHHESPHRP